MQWDDEVDIERLNSILCNGVHHSITCVHCSCCAYNGEMSFWTVVLNSMCHSNLPLGPRQDTKLKDTDSESVELYARSRRIQTPIFTIKVSLEKVILKFVMNLKKYVFFFLGRSWPVFLGAGFGIGKAYRNCELDLNSTLSDSTPKQSKVQ
jgi:hypothetical protein